MSAVASDHYRTLRLSRDCTHEQVRESYRALAKAHHPDLNPSSARARVRIRELNAAYEVLSDPARRRAYDNELADQNRTAARTRGATIQRNIAHDVRLRIDEFFRGTSVDLHVTDPANPNGRESYHLDVPPNTVPGSRFRFRRTAPMQGGFVVVRVRALPSSRFKLRGSDLRCELRIDTRRAKSGGTERLQGPSGELIQITIPPAVERGEIIRVTGKGMPKARGGRGDLLVKITYRPEIRVSHRR